MARIALNKSSLKTQRDRLRLYQRYLPSLDLKRQQLMIEQKKARREVERLTVALSRALDSVAQWAALLADTPVKVSGLVRIEAVETLSENVVGVRVPRLGAVTFATASYSFFASPHWFDRLVVDLRTVAEHRLRLQVGRRRLELLDEAVRRITQRVNLFEKVLIPTAQRHIKSIQVFLSDNERAAVCRSKLAKAKRAGVLAHMGPDGHEPWIDVGQEEVAAP